MRRSNYELGRQKKRKEKCKERQGQRKRGEQKVRIERKERSKKAG
jgi:hypothetical protein